MSCGIYKITNLINGKCYIGQSSGIEKRWKDHMSPSSWKDKPRKVLYKAFLKYGLENFTFEVIRECEEDELSYLEISYISKFDSYYNGYNRTHGGEGVRGFKAVLTRACNYLIKKNCKNFKNYIVADNVLFSSEKHLRAHYNCKGKPIAYIKANKDLDKVEIYDMNNPDHVFLSTQAHIGEINDFICDIKTHCMLEGLSISDVNDIVDKLEIKIEELTYEIKKLELSYDFNYWNGIKRNSELMMFDEEEYLFYECDGDWDLAFGL